MPEITNLKVYVPAKNFDTSCRFFEALGFKPTPAYGRTMDFELNGQQFRLQDFYNKDWAENFMILISTPDVEAWYQLVMHVIVEGRFETARVMPPEEKDGAILLNVIDPSGVLLIFIQ